MYDRILLAHDLSENARPVLRATLDLGRQLHSTVHILHVITPPLTVPPGVWFAVPDADITTFEEKIREAATRELARAVLEATREGDPETRIHVRLGEAGGATLAEARKLDATLLIVGTDGRKGWQHLMLGSVAERVVRTAPVPVLTISTNAAQAWEGAEKVCAVAQQ
jgi:nucleotide-binding universal stress UspA family protein